MAENDELALNDTAVKEAVSEQEEYFGELVGFLQDPKVAVQRLAAEGLLEQTESLELIAYCKLKPRPIARGFLRLVERAEADNAKEEAEAEGAGGISGAKVKKEGVVKVEAMESAAAGAAALKALVNLSTIPVVSNELVEMNAPRRCCEALRGGWLEGRAKHAHWYAMLLANLCSGEAGQKALCAEESHLRFLFSAYVATARPPARDGYDDPMLCLGKVINNVCVLEEGRKIFAGGKQGAGTMALLSAQLADRQRRPDVMSAFKNLCGDTACHPAIITTDFLIRLAPFVYPWEKATPEKRAELPPAVQQALQSGGATLTADASVRNAAADSILGLCLGDESRLYLREGGCYELLRAWLQEEADHDTRVTLEQCVPYIVQTVEELELADDLLARADALPGGEGYDGGEQPPEAPVQAPESTAEEAK